MTPYAPLQLHSQFSLRRSPAKAWQIAARLRRLGLPGGALCDLGSVAGVVQFQAAMKNACKHCGYQGGKDGKPNRHRDGGSGPCSVRGVACPGFEPMPLKAALGSQFWVADRDAADPGDETARGLCVVAKSLDGWKRLVKASSLSNTQELFRGGRPRIDLGRLAGLAGGEWFGIGGFPGSRLADCLFAEPQAAYAARSEDAARSFLRDGAALKRELPGLVREHQAAFGGHFFLAVNPAASPAHAVVAKAMRWVSRETGAKVLACPDAYYPDPADADDQRVLLCTAVDTTLQDATERVLAGPDPLLNSFFRSRRFSVQEADDAFAAEELANSVDVLGACAPYDITSRFRLPDFPCPGGKTPDEHLRDLCRGGWGRLVSPLVKSDPSLREVYRERVERELGVLKEAGLATYFLVVEDIIRHSVEVLKCKPSYGRGSGAGTLVGYLVGIHRTDPVARGLSFERFYNSGRNDVKSGRVSLPDYDMDFPLGKRDLVIDYVRNKYGEDYVAQMATYSRLKAREALTAVFRAHKWGTFEERKAVTAVFPDEAAIADLLQEMREETGEASIITWTLEHESEALKEFASLTDDGDVEGPLAAYFKQAIRLEDTVQVRGKHAAGVVIFPEPLASHFPMAHDKNTGRQVVTFDMGATEACGGTKLDFLSIAALDKIRACARGCGTGLTGDA